MNQDNIQELRDKVADIKYDTWGIGEYIQKVLNKIDSMDAAYQEQTGSKSSDAYREAELEREVAQLKSEVDKLRLDKVCAPTMPVIPKAVAIAIFREGMQHGVESACSELEGQTITVSESGYTGDFEVSFERSIDLDAELDLDWMRGKVGNYSEEFITEALGNLCADEKFECRIHGVDDQKENEQ